jgi:hypothetical protein
MARRANVACVVGLNELDDRPGSLTMYNTQLVIARDGRLLGRHRTPAVSTTSAEPQSEDTERLPFLATLSRVPATTNAVAVDTLKVPAASPPVPAVSMSISRSVPVSAATSSPWGRTRTAL